MGFPGRSQRHHVRPSLAQSPISFSTFSSSKIVLVEIGTGEYFLQNPGDKRLSHQRLSISVYPTRCRGEKIKKGDIFQVRRWMGLSQ